MASSGESSTVPGASGDSGHDHPADTRIGRCPAVAQVKISTFNLKFINVSEQKSFLFCIYIYIYIYIIYIYIYIGWQWGSGLYSIVDSIKSDKTRWLDG